jgi:hypothetical protein
MATHLEDEPPSEVDTADWLRTISKSRGKRPLGYFRKGKCGEERDEEQRGKH